MSLHTNIVRLQLEGNCFCYECGSSKILTFEDITEIQRYVQSLNTNYIYQHPRIYTSDKIQFQKLPIYLSRGQSLYLSVSFFQEVPKFTILKQICHKFMRSLEFLYAQTIDSCFNPFQEKKSSIPGFSVQAIQDYWGLGIAIMPINLHLQPLKQMSSAELILNANKGLFFTRDDVVRVDKNSGQICFRQGQVSYLSHLKKIHIKNISGFYLASKLNNYIQRIKESSKALIQSWQVKLQSRYFVLQSKLINPGSIVFRNNNQRFLNDLTYPIARNTYNHYFRNFFKDVIFQQKLEKQFVFWLPESIIKQAKVIVKQMERLTQNMQLQVKSTYSCFPDLQNRESVLQLCENLVKNPQSMNILVIPSQLTLPETNNLKQFKQALVNKKIALHSIMLEQLQSDELDIVAIRHLSVIYSRLRLHPWKIKNIPFGERAAVVCSLNVQQMQNGSYSIAIVSSLNAFFSKFTSYRLISELDRIHQNIFIIIQKCLDQFCVNHKLYPYRVFIYRSGFNLDIGQQFLQVQQKLSKYYQQINNKNSNTLTYIKTNYLHSIRTCYRTDQNFLSYHTVKKTQLLLTFQLSNKLYIQVQFDQPPLELQIIQIEKDPNFINKVLELTVKLIFGTPGNCFGKGLGFLEYGAKLNEYRNYNLITWQQLQIQGFLMFL